MATIINADTSDGLKFTSDTSGEIKLQSAGTDIVSVTANGMAVDTNTLYVDATNNYVGVGTSSPTTTLDVETTVRSKANAASNDATVGKVSFYNTNASASANPERAYIEAGRENSAWGAYLKFATSTGTNAASEKMRIASDGKVSVGTTDTGFASGVGVKIRPGLDGSIATVDSASTSASTSLIMYSTGASAYRFYVNWAGTIYATSTSITGISDERLKENIVDLDEGLDTVMSLKPRKFDWKNGKGKNIKGDRGFIAQEFETVLPDLTEELKDEVPEGEAPYKGVNLNLIPILVKAIQELKTENDTLKSQLSALETRIQALENA